MTKHYNSKETADLLSGANKRWVNTTNKRQLEKYGNVECITCKIDYEAKTIEFQVGESWGVFKKNWREPKFERDYGPLYHEEQVTKCVNEIAKNLGWLN